MSRDGSRPGLLREIFAQRRFTVAPGCGDALSARLIESAGFDVAYISGAWTAALRGFPDGGLISRSEMLDSARAITDAVAIPVVADIDTGFGGPSAIWRTVRDFERAGLAGVQIEDQKNPKRCGLMAGKEVVETEEMVTRIRVATESRASEEFMIIARSDALASEGVDAVTERGRAYFDAGADALFVEAFQTEDEIDAVAAAFPDRALVFNRTPRGFSPMVPIDKLRALGYTLVIFPMHLVLAAAGIEAQILRAIRESGSAGNLEDLMMPIDEFFDLFGQRQLAALEETYGTVTDHDR